MPGLPADHPERYLLADEAHARPPAALDTPQRATYVAVLVAPEDRGREHAHVAALCAQRDVPPPAPTATHFSATLGVLRLKWERHSEFSSYTFFAAAAGPEAFADPVTALLPPGWLAALPGQTIVAAHAELAATGDDLQSPAGLIAPFAGNVVVGAEIGDGAGAVYTDFRIHADGCARFLVLDRGMLPRQAGRTLQRLFEIEAYRMMALLALPVARRQAPRLLELEGVLARLTNDIAREAHDDEARLGDLTRLAAEVESSLAANQYRFGASRAYYDLVRARIVELREQRIRGMQTIDEFMTRRLAPAVATCQSVAQRLRDLSERVAQASALLSTRVDIAREKQNQALLASMERRARLQLRLQQTVEGLSVAAITYYVVGLIGYGAKALQGAGLHVDPAIATGVAIPFVAALVAYALHRTRRRIMTRDRDPD